MVLIRVPACPVELARIRSALRAFCREHDLGDEIAGRIVLAANEVCTTALDRARPGEHRTFEVDASIDHDVVLTIRELGAGARAPAAPPRPSLGERLVRRLADDVRTAEGASPGAVETVLRFAPAAAGLIHLRHDGGAPRG